MHLPLTSKISEARSLPITELNLFRSLPPAKAILCDLTPRQIVRIAGESLPSGFRRKLTRYRYGPGAFKMDWALNAPVPWRSPNVRKRQRFISAVRLRRSLLLKNSLTQVSTQKSLSSFFASRRSSIRRARRKVNTRCGLTVTSQTDRKWT